MLTEKERQFLLSWEKERERLNSFTSKMLRGLPVAMFFSFPVILLIFVVYVFFPEWYTKISQISQGTFITIVLAIFGCTLFFAYFRMQYKWEMNEQSYRELKNKAVKEDRVEESSINN